MTQSKHNPLINLVAQVATKDDLMQILRKYEETNTELLEALQSIFEHPREFGEIEDFETMAARMQEYALQILEDLIDGFHVESIDVRLKKVTQESPLKELLALAIVVTFQKDLEREVPPVVDALMGANIPDKYDSIVTVLAMIIAIYGISTFFEWLKPAKQPKTLDKDYSTLLQTAGNSLQMQPAQIERAVTKRFSGGMKPLIQRASLDFLRPAKRARGAKIIAADGSYISKEAIAECPGDIDFAIQEDTDQYPLQGVEIDIRALDKDRKKTGWAAVVKDVTKKRLKMQIYPTIDVKKVIGKERIKGDIIVSNKRDDGGSFQPNAYFLVGLDEKWKHSKTRKKKATSKNSSSKGKKKPRQPTKTVLKKP